MTIEKDDNGTIRLFQGDTGNIIFSGFNPEINYTVYFAIRNEDRELIGSELSLDTSGSDTVNFFLPATLTDLLVVPEGESYAKYFWGVKIVNSESTEEDTIVPDIGGQMVMIVFPKVVEGAV